jgi:serine protease Do
MNGLKQTALAAMLVSAAGLVPVKAVQAQSPDRLVRAFDLVRGSRLGISVRDVEDAGTGDAKAAKAGVVVDTVEPGGPGDKAGMKAGDAITEFDGERVRSVRQFARLVQETPPGRTVAVALSRGGQRVSANVTAERAPFAGDFSVHLLETPLARLPTPPAPPAPPRMPSPPSAVTPPFDVFRFVAGRRLGLTVESLDDQLADYFGVKDGVLVRSVAQDSAAHKAGLKAGDVITVVNGRHVYDASDVTRALDRTGDSDEFTIEIVRDRKPQTVKGKLEPRQGSRGSAMMF